MATYIVINGPVEHDGKAFQDGEAVKLEESVAAVLLAAGCIEVKGKASQETKPDA